MMVDWFTGQVAVDASGLVLDQILLVSRWGEINYRIERRTEQLITMPSWSDKVQVRRSVWRGPVPELPYLADKVINADGRIPVLGVDTVELAARRASADYRPIPNMCLEVSGNVLKLLQGHNVWGLGVDHLGLMLRDYADVVRQAEKVGWGLKSIPPGPVEFHPMRLDVTNHFDMGSHQRVHEYLDYVAHYCRSRKGKPVAHPGAGDWRDHASTVTFAQGSRRYSVKFYCKVCEMKKHPQPLKAIYKIVEKYCQGWLRVEVELRQLALSEIKREEWNERSLFWNFIERIEGSEMKAKDLSRLSALPKMTGLMYSAWAVGQLERDRWSVRGFRRHRRIILDTLGVDISCPYPVQPSAEVTPENPVEFSIDWLKAHQVIEIPAELQAVCWRPGGDPSPTQHRGLFEPKENHIGDWRKFGVISSGRPSDGQGRHGEW